MINNFIELIKFIINMFRIIFINLKRSICEENKRFILQLNLFFQYLI